MKRSFLILSILLMPLTLASETQNRFRICILVDGEDTHISNVLEIHLKREFRLLGDVDIVELDENWRFILSIKYIEIEFKDRRKTGSVALADVFNQRLPASFLVDHYPAALRPPVLPVVRVSPTIIQIT